MFLDTENFKVLRSVVPDIMIFVVNMFAAQELTIQKRFHNIPMFKHPPTVNTHPFVTTPISQIVSLPQRITILRAEFLEMLPTRRKIKLLAALNTFALLTSKIMWLFAYDGGKSWNFYRRKPCFPKTGTRAKFEGMLTIWPYAYDTSTELA